MTKTPNLTRAQYSRAYRQGWRHADAADPSLENNPHGGELWWAWEDGYLDNAGDRPKWHRRDCPLRDHNECPTL